LGSVHALDLFVHCFLKLSEIGISENLRFFARLDLSDRVEAEKQHDEQAYET
jgi:hypothetical protein